MRQMERKVDFRFCLPEHQLNQVMHFKVSTFIYFSLGMCDKMNLTIQMFTIYASVFIFFFFTKNIVPFLDSNCYVFLKEYPINAQVN